MSSRYAICLGLCLWVVTASAEMRDPARTDPGTAGARRLADFVRGNILKSAEQMPEEHYGFRPTPAVRTFGEIPGHVANTNHRFCSQAAGDANTATADIEKTVRTRADLIGALRQSFDYCDKVLGAMNDRAGSELITFPGGDLSRLSVIALNTAHNFERYGNLTTYLRMKGLVPPSSQPSR
jgi:hypothetical protein